ncbi:MAG: hypothetical protein WAW90_02865 [Minisyncoccia bacterium]
MYKTFSILLVLLLLPTSSHASRAPSSFSAARSLLAASSSPGNAYTAGLSIIRTAPVAGDLVALGGSIVTAAPVSGDELLFAGSIYSRATVGGDFRAAGGDIAISEPIAGDLVAVGLSVRNDSRTNGSVLIVAANTTLSGGSAGPVTIYGNNISLAGDFAGDVTIVASGRVALAASTTIAGKLLYEAPEPAIIPASASTLGGIVYTSASYLPNVGASRTLALMSVGLLLLVRILGALILAGLFAGLFPRFAEGVVEHVFASRTRSILLTTLLGFAVGIVTPILCVLLALTFVGIGLSLLIGILYVLLLLLSFVYAGILTGGILARHVMKREEILWRDGVIGMATLSLATLVPFVGSFVAFLFACFSAGTLLQISFHFAFSHEDPAGEVL